MSGIIDAHTHIWRRESGDYGWITPDLGALDHDFGLDDLRAEREALGVDQFVLVQAADTAGDTDRMLAEAARHPEVVGVVAWLPLADPELDEALAARRDTGLVVGVRTLIHDMADTEWVLRDDVARGSRPHRRCRAVVRLRHGRPCGARAGADARGAASLASDRDRPPRQAADRRGCRDPLALGVTAAFCRGLAERRREAVGTRELGGLARVVDGGAASPRRGRGVDAFGPERLMFGGDWPVCLLAGGYTRTFEGLHDALDVSPADLEHIHHRTATQWYRLDERTTR